MLNALASLVPCLDYRLTFVPESAIIHSMTHENLANFGGVSLCGGKGSRIESITQAQGGMPKPLLEVGGKKLIRYTTDLMDPKYVPQLVFTVGHKAEDIRGWVESADLPYRDITFAPQVAPGALRAMLDAMPQVSQDQAIVANADEIRLNLNLADAINFHKHTGRLATLITTHTNNLSRHRVIERREKDGLVVSAKKQPDAYRNMPETIGLVNAGIIIFDKAAIEHADYNHDIDWSGLLDPLSDAGQLAAYVAPDMTYFNVGTPEEYFEAENFLIQNKR